MAKTKQNEQPTPDEQSGSTGRNTDAAAIEPRKDTGQGRYGQSGLGGKTSEETKGQADYRRSGPSGASVERPDSNRGSGEAGHEQEEYRGNHRGRKPGSRTGSGPDDAESPKERR